MSFSLQQKYIELNISISQSDKTLFITDTGSDASRRLLLHGITNDVIETLSLYVAHIKLFEAVTFEQVFLINVPLCSHFSDNSVTARSEKLF